MCVVSNIGEIGRTMWPSPGMPKAPLPWDDQLPVFPKWVPEPFQTIPAPAPKSYNGPTKEQFEEFLELLRAARKFDKATGQADCEQESKVGWIRAMAKELGISDDKLKEIFS